MHRSEESLDTASKMSNLSRSNDSLLSERESKKSSIKGSLSLSSRVSEDNLKTGQTGQVIPQNMDFSFQGKSTESLLSTDSKTRSILRNKKVKFFLSTKGRLSIVYIFSRHCE